MAWKKSFEHKQRELVAWMKSIDERIDIYNRRVRKLEKLAKMQGGELRAIIQRLNEIEDVVTNQLGED